MRVLKFGGSSVASPESLEIVKEIIKEKQEKGPLAVVVSAVGGITQKLVNSTKLAEVGDQDYLKLVEEIEQKHISLCQTLLPVQEHSSIISKIKLLLNELEDILRGVSLIQELTPKTQDKIMSYGELLSSHIIAAYLKSSGLSIEWTDSRELIRTDNLFNRANVNFTYTNKAIEAHFSQGAAVKLLPGFIASNATGETTTLGRGGSDYTAAIVAAALNAEQLEIWSDVSGLMTADPRHVKSALAIKEIHYEEAMELSHFGAKVIYPPSIQPVLHKGIPILIKNTFDKNAQGTLVHDKLEVNDNLVQGISCIQNIALLSLSGSTMVGIPNFSHRLFGALAKAKVNVILITQASSEHSICVGIAADDVPLSLAAVEEEFFHELATYQLDPVQVEEELAIVALVGSSMKNQIGVSGTMFSRLSENGINIKAIAQGSSEKNISAVIHERQVKKALNSLHESFFTSDKKRLNLFIVGVGNVGKALLEQLETQKAFLSENRHLELEVVAVANSRKMYFDEEGLEIAKTDDLLESKGEKMELSAFIDKMQSLNLRNSVFIDNTANEVVAGHYKEVLQQSISVVTPNKIACTQSFSSYQELKKTALRYQAKYLFETNVGAGLPVINTLNDLIRSGDEVLKIEAVLSGSLNFIFNNYNKETSFLEVVKEAQVQGFTEPDPRIDLSGIDVKRKILILIRESGFKMELDEIEAVPFIPESCMNQPSVEKFLEELPKHEQVFLDKVEKAESEGKKLKYVATYNEGKAETGLRFVDKAHPFYNLEGKDNIVLFYTKRYQDQPLVIKGAGAGAAVTASGIFADIMRIANAH